MYVYETHLSIAQTTLQSSMIAHVFTLEQTKKMSQQKKTITYWTRSSDAYSQVKGTAPYLFIYLVLRFVNGFFSD